VRDLTTLGAAIRSPRFVTAFGKQAAQLRNLFTNWHAIDRASAAARYSLAAAATALGRAPDLDYAGALPRSATLTSIRAWSEAVLQGDEATGEMANALTALRGAQKGEQDTNREVTA